MAFNHIHFDDTLPHGRLLRRALRANEEADEQLADVVSLFEAMLDGDGSQDAHYAEITSRFAFTSNAKAHAAFNELASAYAKTSGNSAVTNVRAARDQLFAFLRG